MHAKEGGSILIISHQERILNIADKIVVIAGGNIDRIGTPAEVMPHLLNAATACSALTEKL